MIPHLVWAFVALVVVVAVVVERRRGRLSASEAERLEHNQHGIAKSLAERIKALEDRPNDTAALRKDVDDLKRTREREGLGKLRGA